jgi:Na+-transporting NADH:ubiquinone oxidoreductase subunit F
MPNNSLRAESPRPLPVARRACLNRGQNNETIMAIVAAKRKYSLVGENTILALQKGLAEATWYTSPVPKEKMRELLERQDGPAIRDTLIWFTLLIGSGVSAYMLWRAGSWWAAIPFVIYGAIYASTSDSRWHEAGHGTAFKTDWMNNVLYEIASFMVMRESVPWRWSHTRHHSDTIIVGRDPEIAVPRPPDVLGLVLGFFGLRTIPKYFRAVLLHCAGRLTAEEKTYIPESEYGKVFVRARFTCSSTRRSLAWPCISAAFCP